MSAPLNSGTTLGLGVADSVRARAWPVAVGTAMLAWWAALFALVRSDYVGFRLGRFDFGNMIQAISSTAEGRPLEITDFAGDQMVRLGGHADPILALFAPLWIVLPTPPALAATQIAALSLGALPVFWLGRRHLASENAAGLLALSYLAYPWVAWSTLEGFRPVTFAIPLLLLCVWFLDSDRLVPFAVCAVLAVSTGELIGLGVAALGVWYAFSHGRRLTGFVIAVAATAWTVLAVYVVIPAFAGRSSPFYGYYAEIGGSPQGVIRTLFTDPTAVAAELFTPRDLLYLLALVLPLCGLCLLAPGLAAVSIPQLLANWLAGPLIFTDPRDHYSAGAIPFLIAAAVIGTRRLSPRRQLLAAKLVLMMSLGLSVLVGAWPGAPGKTAAWDAVDHTPNQVESLRRAVAMVPSEAAVSTTNKAGSHLSARRYVYSVPVIERARWIVLDTHDPFVATPDFPVLAEDAAALAAFRRRIERSAAWKKVFDEEGVLVFRRAGAGRRP